MKSFAQFMCEAQQTQFDEVMSQLAAHFQAVIGKDDQDAQYINVRQENGSEISIKYYTTDKQAIFSLSFTKDGDTQTQTVKQNFTPDTTELTDQLLSILQQFGDTNG